ncbi:aminotransferase class I/II-fold pyridoxal phosphate-dependent enzyme [Christensenella tenuis]|uniref:Aminotransferase class I/II-fold pyridoxal phosphate-dependent enzyme n=1 Tax=Christensenella tenuis TaxID=2763033 RepID=A0ABR7EI35_9FIRM|nr:aminotransferase class I/II-fold pyridoxal phosphate-dependent enzyme [Christensenella tenuis]MBC5648669.1 aminotransferase class I/II-fold pyridoxal phosphate-dependent enzyme [Christensenella tenuis]
MKFANKMKVFDLNIFSKLEEKRAELLQKGMEVINLSVGTPDFRPDGHVIAALKEAAGIADNFKYSLADLPELVEAVIAWYGRRYDVSLTPQQVMSVYGTQEGMAHVALPICNPGDLVIAPDPCYPVFMFGPRMAEAEIYYTPLKKENNFLIDFGSIPEDVARRAKMIVVSYPNNPVTAVADYAFYEKLVAWAKKYDVIVVHDNAYSELVMDSEPGMSFLAVPGAMDVGIEFNSLSKSYNLTGLRISFAMGNTEIIRNFRCLRSQIDYGISFPVQKAAIAALNGPQDILERNRKGYRERRDALCGGLRSIGWNVPDSPGTMFVWAPLPEGYEKSWEFALELMDKTGVICTPGESFGPAGEGFVRLALVADVPTIERAVRLIRESGMVR